VGLDLPRTNSRILGLMATVSGMNNLELSVVTVASVDSAVILDKSHTTPNNLDNSSNWALSDRF